MNSPTDNDVQSYTEPAPLCIHAKDSLIGCPMCWYDSTGPKIDVDLGPDL